MTEKEIAGYKNLDMGHIFCSRCFYEYVQRNAIPERIKKEFTPIYNGEKWALGPSCTECNKKIVW